MSRSITVMNTSNWEHEDCVVKVAAGGEPAALEERRLVPGQAWKMPKHQEVNSAMVIVEWPTPKEGPQPFRDKDGNQLVFEVDGKWEKVPKRS